MKSNWEQIVNVLGNSGLIQIIEKKKIGLLFSVLTLGTALWLSHTGWDKASAVNGAVSRPQLKETYGKIPLGFESNVGQVSKSTVKFLSRGAGYSLFVTPQKAFLAMRQKAGARAMVGMNLQGSNSQALVEGLEKQAGTSNYFIGNNPAQWHRGVARYSQVRVKDAYAGIDMVYYGNQGQLEYDFVVKPRADADQIRLSFDGAESLKVKAGGDLEVAVKGGHLTFQAPVVYQKSWGNRVPVAGRFVMTGKNQVGFQVGPYDHSQNLVIDPVLVYSTYLGGSNNDNAQAIAVDASGNVYVVGSTASTNIFQASAPGFQKTLLSQLQDNAFVVKMNPSQTQLIYATYLGGDINDYGTAIAVDAAGDAYVTGTTYSYDFPLSPEYHHPHAYQTSNVSGVSAFVTKFDPTGTILLYSTYLSGTATTYGLGIAVNSNENAYVTGTATGGFPTTGAIQPNYGGGSSNGFVTELDGSANGLVMSTYLGGNGFDASSAIALDSEGNVYVAGYSSSTNYPTTAGAYQRTYKVVPGGTIYTNAFLSKLSPGPNSTLLYSTYLGGSVDDYARGVAVDGSGNAYITGGTNSPDFPVTPHAFQWEMISGGDAFVTKLSPSGNGAKDLLYSTFIWGGSMGNAIAVDGSGDIHVTGNCTTHFPTTTGAYQTTDPTASSQTTTHAFYFELNPASQGVSDLVYSTYLGGNGIDQGHGIAVYNGYLYKDVYLTGLTQSTNFPVVGAAYQSAKPSGAEISSGFVAEFYYPGLFTRPVPIRIEENAASRANVIVVPSPTPTAKAAFTFTPTATTTATATVKIAPTATFTPTTVPIVIRNEPVKVSSPKGKVK